jgi:hypothetical protein
VTAIRRAPTPPKRAADAAILMLAQIKDLGLSLMKDADKSNDGHASQILTVVDSTIDLWTKMVRATVYVYRWYVRERLRVGGATRWMDRN